MHKLREYRESKKLSQRDLAKYMGLTQAGYWALEKGKSLLNTQQILKLCELYKCSPNDLLDFKAIYHATINELDK